MEDQKIIELYFDRNETAISETDKKYGSYCHTIAYRILQNLPDAEECVNDTWLRAWNAMPPQRPSVLRQFLAKITRNLSLDRWRGANAEKRGGGEAALALEELGECVSTSTKENLTVRVAAENGATSGKFELAKMAKELGLDAIHDTVHEMARDEARHGKAFAGLLARYFG